MNDVDAAAGPEVDRPAVRAEHGIERPRQRELHEDDAPAPAGLERAVLRTPRGDGLIGLPAGRGRDLLGPRVEREPLLQPLRLVDVPLRDPAPRVVDPVPGRPKRSRLHRPDLARRVRTRSGRAPTPTRARSSVRGITRIPASVKYVRNPCARFGACHAASRSASAVRSCHVISYSDAWICSCTSDHQALPAPGGKSGVPGFASPAARAGPARSAATSKTATARPGPGALWKWDEWKRLARIVVIVVPPGVAGISRALWISLSKK